MNQYTFHISLYGLALMALLFSELTFVVLLSFSKNAHQKSSRLLAAALSAIVIGISILLVEDMGFSSSLTHWRSIPFISLLALAPFLFCWVNSLTNSSYKLTSRQWLHFSPMACIVIFQSLWPQIRPVVPWLAFISICSYLYLSQRLIQQYYQRQPLLEGDRPLRKFRWLQNMLTVVAVIWITWLPLTVATYIWKRSPLTTDLFHLWWLLLGIIAVYMAAMVHLQSETTESAEQAQSPKPSIPAELKQKAAWLKQTVKEGRLFEDPDLSVQSLAAKLNLSSHELSRIINTGTQKNFADFIGEYRVAATIAKMRDPKNDHLTLMGIAYDAGFNSKTSFNRIFKETTGKTPVEYKNDLKKGVSIYKMGRRPLWQTVISGYQKNTMFKNYWKTAWRNLLKNKFYSAINISGLTLGLAVGILVLLWVQDELGFDGFYKKAKEIYRLELWGGTGNNRQIFTIGVAPIGPFSKKQLPAVLDYTRLKGNYDYSLYKYKDKVFDDELSVYADPSLFSMFDLTLLQGNNQKPFTDDNSVVITQSTAAKFFGHDNPIGKVITGDNKVSLTVSGVIADIPKNASIRYDMIMPISYHFKTQLAQHNDLSNNFSYLDYLTFLQIKPGTDLKQLAKKITGVHLAHKADDTDAEYLLLPLTKMHLYHADMTDNGISTVRIFIAIALLILIIACINYTNLSTARSMLRAKEISMRKIIGAEKRQLFLQFIVETALLFFIAALLAVGLIFLLMPAFNKVSGKEMHFNLGDYRVWLLLLYAVTGTLAASSIYPALLLSSFEPLKALKGKITAGVRDVLFRKILVVAQFAFSIILITGTIVITRQLNYIRTTGAGYDKTNVLTLWMRDMAPHYDAVKADLLKQPGISAITRSNQNIIHFQGFVGNVDWDGKDPNQNIIMHPIVVDRDLISFFKMQLVAGTSFTGGQIDSSHYILNEAAIKEMGIKDPVGKRFSMRGTTGTIIGVVKDFHYASMKEKIAPSIFWFAPQYLNTMYIRTTAGGNQQAIAAVAKQFRQYNGDYLFGYAFLDDVFDNLYKSEQREGTLFTDFAAIAIFISCLGLLGLTAYTAQVRTREIGVRKVLGANNSGIIRLLAKDFIKLVLIAIVIAVPISWYGVNQWLADFAYRIPVNWWVFALSGGAAILIAFMTISLQAVKAALANPVKTLRSE